jgi:uncharacterized protein YkwD
MNTLVISIIFCLAIGELVNARAKRGLVASDSFAERAVDELMMLTRENEESVIDESISVNPDQREVDDSLMMARREKLSKYDNKNYEEDIQRRSLITQREQQAFERTNLARQSGRYCGSKWYPAARPLVWNSLLANAALGHAIDMRNKHYFDEISKDGRTVPTRIRNAGYRYCDAGENISQEDNPDTTVQRWLNSPDHCANIMNSKYRDIGIGQASDLNYNSYWVQTFGNGGC